MYRSSVGWLDNGLPLDTPTITSLSTTTGGAGALHHSTSYSYRVSALNGAGETLASPEVSITTPANGGVDNINVVVTWQAVNGATSYNVYGRTAAGELLIANVAAPTVTFTDAGTIAPAGALPASNTTGASSKQKVVVTSIVSATQLYCQKAGDYEGHEANSAIPNQPSAGNGPLFMDNRLKPASYGNSDMSAFNSGFTLYFDDQLIYGRNLTQSF